jgi:hypothetical protein
MKNYENKIQLEVKNMNKMVEEKRGYMVGNDIMKLIMKYKAHGRKGMGQQRIRWRDQLEMEE